MTFDRAKAMRNAERYVASGKLRSAIAEYRAVVDHDPRDMATLNMLGDLYAKNSDNRDAVKCYFQVAEHYNRQGFSQKAIAVYNKISRLHPDLIEVSAKLADLHRSKGSLAEAREHYKTVADHYQKQGRRLEALATFKQIAMLDPNNTEVCLNLAESYLTEGQRDDAVEAYAEAGARFSRLNSHEEAIWALTKGLEIKPTDLRILNGLVKAQAALGRAGKAAKLLEDILEKEPYNRDVLYLLIDCCLEAQNAAGAEKAVIKLVEIEPANYPKFLDLIRIYLNVNDPESAARILTMSSEYLLAGGQSDECGKWINEVLERDPNQLAGLRLLVRFNSWLNDLNGVREALERLYLSAAAKEAVEDERYALAQLVVMRPHETRYRDRFDEINATYGFEDVESDGSFFPDTATNERSQEQEAVGVERFDEDQIVDAQVIENAVEAAAANGNGNGSHSNLSHADEEKLQKELDSICFYIENDYNELALKALAELTGEFGDLPEIADLRRRIGGEPPEPEVAGVVQQAEVVADVVANTLGIDEIRSEFGLEDQSDTGEDYDTHYHTAVAYQEMGLLEEAIREFQEAANFAAPNDGTRRFFQCANLLGHCFMQNSMAKHAITWFNRALETQGLTDAENHGIWYELALAHEANNDEENATKYFEKIYTEDVGFRDVAERVKELVAH